jgi:hypothetical protein
MKYDKYKIDASAGRLSLKLKIVIKHFWQWFLVQIGVDQALLLVSLLNYGHI